MDFSPSGSGGNPHPGRAGRRGLGLLGQSNMAMTLSAMENAAQEFPEANYPRDAQQTRIHTSVRGSSKLYGTLTVPIPADQRLAVYVLGQP
jgi:hypothetical protein